MTADATLPASDDLTPEVLARWEELATNATEGPWKVQRDGILAGVADDDDGYIAEPPLRWTDAEFIAAARTAVPALLSGVRSRDARIAELEAALERQAELQSETVKQLEARAAEAEAVIAKVRGGWMDVDLGHVEFGRLVFELLEASPSEILARVKSETKAEALEEAAAEAGRAHALTLSSAALATPDTPPEGAIYMPNAQRWLLDRAAAYRVGADHE